MIFRNIYYKVIPTIVGLFLTAALFTAISQTSWKKPVVLLDHYFNREVNKKTGMAYHYLWSDTLSSGFSGWGKIFIHQGFDTVSLQEAPESALLDRASVYIIVDPDDERESVSPHLIEAASIKVIERWVSNGGILVLMANDSGNCEFAHFNQLAGQFGFRFNEVRRNVPGAGNADMEKATFRDLPDHPFFKGVHAIFIKEICTLKLQDPSTAVFTDGGDQLIAVIPHGKGLVLAIPDPWFYNEYLNGEARCRLNSTYQNDRAAANIAGWLFDQTQKRK